MILMRILPGVLKELLKHVPTVLFEVVEWSALASELPKLSRRIIQKEGFSELFDLQGAFLKPFKIQLTSDVLPGPNLKNNTLAAERILTLYFLQLQSPYGLFLDLRANHFYMQDAELQWHPNGLWTKFSPEFSDGLNDIYDGFYLEDENLFRRGLLKIGLISESWPETDKQKLADLFRANFGSSVSEDIRFDLEIFKESLLKVTDFMLEKKVKISTDFLYLGIALVTLYSGLEETEAKVNVKKIYLSVKEQLKTK